MALPEEGGQQVNETPEQILDLRRLDEDHFVASGTIDAGNPIGTLFGGRLVGQALLAASIGVETMPITSFHAYFLAGGKVGEQIDYRVTRLRDSRRFANRQVSAFQQGQMIFTLMCEFHTPEAGFDHQHAVMPDVPPPEEVMPIQQFVREHEGRIDLSAVRNFSGVMPIELRPVAPESYFMRRSDQPRSFWFRLPGATMIDDARLHQCLTAYGSDYWLAGVAAVPHIFPTNGRELLICSLDHAMWFHRPVRCDEWLLHHTTSPSAGEGLGLAQGRIFDRHGRLVATTTQECLLRRLQPV